MNYYRVKPIFEKEMERKYVQHKESLAHIINSPATVMVMTQTDHLKKMHSRSISYRQQKEEQTISKEN
jgi:hypothetical protein